MSTLITNIDNTKLKVRWQEPYVSVALNKQFAAHESGILFGFKPAPGGLFTLNLETNSSTGTSAMAVRDTADGLSVLYVEEANLSVDLTAFASQKVWLGVSVSYSSGVATTGQIRAYTSAEVDAGLGDVDVICSVNVPSHGFIAATDIGYENRSFYWKERFESDDFHLQNAVGSNSMIHDTILYADGRSPGNPLGTGVNTTLEGVSGSVTPRPIKFAYGSVTASGERLVAVAEAMDDDFVLVRYRVKFVSASAASVGVGVIWLNDAGYVVSYESKLISPVAALTQDWSVRSEAFVAPSGSCYAKVYALVNDMTAGTVYFEQFFVTTPKSGGYHDALPASLTQTFNVAGFLSHDVPAELGLVRYDGSGYFGIEAPSSPVQLKGYDGVYVTATYGSIDLSATQDINLNQGTNLKISGGYGSSGATFDTGGSLSTNGNLTVDGTTLFGGGGYGGSGVTIGGGNVSAKGYGIFDGTLSVGGGYVATTGSGLTVATNGNMSSNGNGVFDGTLSVAGGYLSTGVSIDASGNITAAGYATIDGQVSVGGGYGSTGTTLYDNGAISANGAVTFGSTLAVTGQATFGGGYVATTGSGATIYDTGAISSNGAVTLDSTLSVGGDATFGGGYAVSGTGVTISNATGNVSANGSLTVDGRVACDTKGSFKWYGGSMIAAAAGVTANSTLTIYEESLASPAGTFYLKIPVPTLPYGATITSYGALAIQASAGSPQIVISLRKVTTTVGASTVSIVSTATVTGTGAGAVLNPEVTATNGAGGDEVRSASGVQYFLSIALNNSTVAAQLALQWVYLNYTMTNLDVENY